MTDETRIDVSTEAEEVVREEIASEAEVQARKQGKPGKPKREPGETKLWHALVTFGGLIGIMAVSIIHYGVDVHVPMFFGVIIAGVIALIIGYDLVTIEKAMMDGIYMALQAVIILAIIGILIGVWIVSGVVPAMIYYGLKILSPSIFLFAALIICSITSLATGTSWGTMGTMGVALMGIAVGLGVPVAVAAGAVISGAYFGDKMSPLSDTTNLAPAMAGTDVFTHVKFMFLPTGIAYGISAAVFLALGFHYVSTGVTADVSNIQVVSNGIADSFNINPVLLLPPVIVIVAVVFKVPAIPGIVLGIVSACIIGPLVQGESAGLGALMDCGMNGFVSETGVTEVDDLLTSGGLMNMMYSISLTILAMMFGGIAEKTKQLEVIVSKLMKLVKRAAGLVVATIVTCFLSNAAMPEQYISIVVPGRMYAPTYRAAGLHPKTLSNALESSGTVTSALVPWNTCGVFILGTLGVSTFQYLPYAIFNYLMPIIVIIMAYTGHALANKDGHRMVGQYRVKGSLSVAATE